MSERRRGASVYSKHGGNDDNVASRGGFLPRTRFKADAYRCRPSAQTTLGGLTPAGIPCGDLTTPPPYQDACGQKARPRFPETNQVHRSEVRAFTSQGLPEDATRREGPPSPPWDAGTSAPVPSPSSPRTGVTAPSVMTGLADPDQARQRVTRAVRLAEAGMCPAATSKQEGCPESTPSSLLSFQGGGSGRADWPWLTGSCMQWDPAPLAARPEPLTCFGAR